MAVAPRMSYSRKHRNCSRMCSRVHGMCSRARPSDRMCSHSSLPYTLPELKAVMAQVVATAKVAVVMVMVVEAMAKEVAAVAMVLVVVAKEVPPSARHSQCSRCRGRSSRTPTRAHHHRTVARTGEAKGEIPPGCMHTQSVMTWREMKEAGGEAGFESRSCEHRCPTRSGND